MAKKSGLGRGFDSIFSDNTPESSAAGNSIQTIRISELEPNRAQPRQVFSGEALAELADSISANGILQPLLCRKLSSGTYQIIAGERRWRAAKMAGLTEVPVIIMDLSDADAAQVALIENIQRENLNAYEEAQAYRSLISDFSLTQEEVAQKVGKNRSTVTNSLRLLDLPDDVAQMLRDETISAGHARALLALKNKEDMASVAAKTAAKGLSVRALEDLVRACNRAKKPSGTEQQDNDAVLRIDYVKDLEKRMMKSLGRKIRISAKGPKKSLSISFTNDDDLTELIRQIAPDILD